MNNRMIRYLILVISIALLGLTAIQVYWINSAVALKEDEFKRKAIGALRNTAYKLEKFEAYQNFKSHLKNEQLLSKKIDALRKKRRMGRSTSSKRIIIDSVGNGGVHIEIVEEHHNLASPRKRQRSSRPGKSEWNFGISGYPTTKLEATQKMKNEADSLMQISALNSMDVWEEMISEMMDLHFFKDINQRVDKDIVDSILRDELRSNLILANFEFGVFDNFGRAYNTLTSEEHFGELYATPYKVKLFPNDYLGETYFLSVHFPNQKGYLLGSMWGLLTISTLFLLIIIGAFSFTINTIVKQKKLSVIKNDFINNMTHELKTPISTISLACEALTDSAVEKSKGMRSNFIEKIRQENRRLGLLVENVLKSALWDKGEFKLDKSQEDIHEIIDVVGKSFDLKAQEKNAQITYVLDAPHHVVLADKVHITNALYNLLDNALKYSKENPIIKVGTTNSHNKLIIYVEDNGIGISKENQKKIFEKFYRVPTGNVHDVRGFGLGLNYVQEIVSRHEGQIRMDSSPGNGSRFEIELPITENTIS